MEIRGAVTGGLVDSPELVFGRRSLSGCSCGRRGHVLHRRTVNEVLAGAPTEEGSENNVGMMFLRQTVGKPYEFVYNVAPGDIR